MSDAVVEPFLPDVPTELPDDPVELVKSWIGRIGEALKLRANKAIADMEAVDGRVAKRQVLNVGIEALRDEIGGPGRKEIRRKGYELREALRMAGRGKEIQPVLDLQYVDAILELQKTQRERIEAVRHRILRVGGSAD
ncbi:MAG: hypothetical protein V1908_02460 [Candidatus Peregrinibacteria bacterium]